MKKFVVFFLFFAAIVGFFLLRAQTGQEGSIAPLNPDFVKYMEAKRAGTYVNEDPRLGHRPGPVDMSYYVNSPVGEGRNKSVNAYAATYDLRTYGKVTPVKNQGGCGSCWSFGAFGSLESSLLTGETRNFAEIDLARYHGFDWAECDGGNAAIATAYLARWAGPYNESDYPYPYTPNGAAVQKHIQTIPQIPARTSYADNDTIKWFLTTYGAVNFAYYHNDSYYNAANYAFYRPGTGSNHEICIAGWDDNFDRTKFAAGNLPPHNGAWLCKNSWGTGWGNAGYFWMSYDNTIYETTMFMDAQSASNYQRIYLYDTFGYVYGFGYGTTTAWGANVFTAATNDPLKAIAFITNDKSCNVTYYVYKNPTAGNPTSGTLFSSGTIGTYLYAGYYTYALPAPISLTAGDTFSVVVKFINNSYTYPLALDGYLSGYSSMSTSAAGQSYYSSNGTSWTDFCTSYAAYKFNCCIKAFAGSGPIRKDDFLATYGCCGIYIRNSDSNGWALYEAIPASEVAAGDVDGDGIDDVLGTFAAYPGMWVKKSTTGVWTKIDWATPDWITAGDMNGDGRKDFMGTYAVGGTGVYYMDSVSGAWVRLDRTNASQITAGDLDGDGKADLIGMWPTDGGIWVRWSIAGNWSQILSIKADWIAAGDMNGDGRSDFVGSFPGLGIYYRNSISTAWVKVEPTAAQKITVGDIDGDGTADLIGIFAADPGIWLRKSSTAAWYQLDWTKAAWMATGKMRAAGSGFTNEAAIPPTSAPSPLVRPLAFAGSPFLSGHEGGLDFTDSIRKIDVEKQAKRAPGPGEPGFLPVVEKGRAWKR